MKELSEEERKKKEAQLYVNLAKVMEALGDSLLDAELTAELPIMIPMKCGAFDTEDEPCAYISD